MDNQEIFDKVVADFKAVFSSNVPLTRETVLKDLKEWDSLAQVSFLARLEQSFSVKFKMKEIVAFRSVGQIVDVIEKMLH